MYICIYVSMYLCIYVYMYFSVHTVIFFAPVSPKFLGSAVVFAEVTGGAGPRCAGQRSWHVQSWVVVRVVPNFFGSWGFSGWISGQFHHIFVKICCKILRFPWLCGILMCAAYVACWLSILLNDLNLMVVYHTAALVLAVVSLEGVS